MKSYQIHSNLANIWAKFAKNQEFFFLKSKNGPPKILLKSNVLCTKIWGIVKFFLKSKNFFNSNVLKSKIHFNNMIIQYRNWPAFGIMKAFFWALSDRSNIFDGITNNIMVNLRFHPLNQLWFVIIQTFSLNYDSF